jgi:hypothetical protein
MYNYNSEKCMNDNLNMKSSYSSLTILSRYGIVLVVTDTYSYASTSPSGCNKIQPMKRRSFPVFVHDTATILALSIKSQ